jgi:hypothetical protein
MGSSLHAYQRGICSCLQKLLIHQFTQLYLEGNKDLGNSLSGEECILPVCLSNEYDVHIGDTKMIKLSDKDVTYYVAGIYTDPYQTSTAYDSDILVQKLPTGGRLTIAVYGKDAVTGMEIEAKYRETYPDIFSGSIMTLENRISNVPSSGKS